MAKLEKTNEADVIKQSLEESIAREGTLVNKKLEDLWGEIKMLESRRENSERLLQEKIIFNEHAIETIREKPPVSEEVYQRLNEIELMLGNVQLEFAKNSHSVVCQLFFGYYNVANIC